MKYKLLQYLLLAFLFYSCNDKTISTDNESKIDNYTEKQIENIFDTIGWKIYFEKKYIPKTLMDQNDIANPDDSWEATDLIINKKSPRKKLVFVSRKNNIWILNYMQGGWEIQNCLIISEIKNDSLISIKHGILKFEMTKKYNFFNVIDELVNNSVKFKIK